jgi:alkylation response protein AidB-like acyl-CoA dehydrogenase
MILPRRAVFDDDHESFRASVARLLVAEPTEFLSAASKHGFVALAVPESAGGNGVEDPRFAAIVLEEAMAAGQPAIALSVAIQESFALPMLLAAPDRLADVARDLSAGRLRLTVVDGSGAVRAEPRGDSWALDGAVDTVLNGQSAGLLLVLARAEERVLLFVLDGTAPGLTRIAVADQLGLEDADIADLHFADVRVTDSDRIEADLNRARAQHRLALAVAAVAGARTALATTVEYVKQRTVFGTPIASFGNTRHEIGALSARITAVEAFVDASLARWTDLSAAEAAALHLCATEILGEAVDSGVQLHGGYGYMWEYPIARAYAAARFFRVYGAGHGEITEVLARAAGL